MLLLIILDMRAMNKLLRYLGIIALTLTVSLNGSGQCNTNTSICAPGTAGPFNFVTPGPGVSSCLDWFGPNIGYIILHITSSGPLNMLIDGNSSSGFLDVSVFNIPAGQSPCTAIQNSANEIGCNYASASSGCNQFGTSFPCASSVPAPNVVAGQELMIVVENWSGSSSNFTLQLGPPPGAQTGPPNPAITPVGPFCVTSGSVQLIAADMGGTWSGPGVSSTGLFNPATAGIGTHTINYSVGTAPCNASSSTTITVTSATVSVSPAVTICSGASTTLTASGASTYSWTPGGSLSATSGASVTATPGSTTTYTVTGTTAGCNSTANVTVTVSPNPTVNAVTNQSVCAGTNVTSTVFSGGAAGTVYNWTNSNTAIGLGASGSGPLPAFTATNSSGSPISGTITVTPTLGACTGNPITFTITVNGSNTTVSPNATICSGGSTTLTAGGATSYSWSPGSGLSATSGATVTANPLVTTTYTVTGTTAGCTSTATVTVTVGGNPTVNAVANQTYCAGDAAPSVTFSGGPAGTVYDWTNSNTGIGAPASGVDTWPAFSATNAGAAAITSTITVTPSIGACIGNPITFDITVNPTPSITAGNNGPLCLGTTIDLTASNVVGGTYVWSGPNGYNNNTQNPTITNSVAGDFGTYTVTVTAAGCSNAATTTVVQNPGTQPTITQVGPYCANSTAVNLAASVAGGTWSGTGITNTATGLFDPASAVIGNNLITYTTANGCTNPATTTIVVNAIPTIQFAGDVLTGCAPLDVTLTDQSTPVSSAVTWTFGDGTPNSNQLGSVDHTFTSPGCYDITLSTTSNGCSNTATLQNYICVLPKAEASFYVDDATQTISDPTFTFINTSVNATTYSWEFGDGTGSTLIHPSHTYPALPGNYTVVLYADNAGGCIDSAKINVSIKDELIFHVPNAFTPDGDEFNNTFKPVFYSGYDPYSYTLTMYDRWGEILFESHDVELGWDGTYNNELAKEGIYTWTIKFKDIDNDKKMVYSGHVSLIE
jgi:trimeric autotransporter adhesin